MGSPGTPDRDGLFRTMLPQLGAPASANNVAILDQWADWENTAARWNPLATTRSAPGSTCFNCPRNKVQNYPSLAVGAKTTADTIANGYYPTILAALRADQPISYWQCTPAIAAELHIWGTGGFATWLQTHCAGTPPPAPPAPPPPPHPPYGNLPLPGQGTTIGAPAAPQSPAAANSTAGSEALGLLLLAGGGAGLWYVARRQRHGTSTEPPRGHQPSNSPSSPTVAPGFS